MITILKLEEFLSRNRISQETWKASAVDWELLIAIGQDYEHHEAQLREYAGMLARVMQQYNGVHSVRWRIKDCEHMLEKIVRKRAAQSEKYLEIDTKNYYSIITDLIGIRALHLFKNEALEIDASIRENQQLIDTEQPLVYTRKGDTVSEDVFPRDRFEHREHPAGYRSVHYIIKAQPQKRQVFAEVQVRTIFEEGWSEIDHRVRYPNFNSDEMVNVFLAIFNRLAGQADEMGSFVQALAQASTTTQAELASAHDEKRKSLEAMDDLISELEQKTEQHAKSQGAVVKLKEELSRMRSAADVAETSTGLFSGKWMEDIQRNSEFAKNFSSIDLAERARLTLAKSMEPSKYLQNLKFLQGLHSLQDLQNLPSIKGLDEINKMVNTADINSHLPAIDGALRVPKASRKKKNQDIE
jgi:putative GTP pyrophosphokinase